MRHVPLPMTARYRSHSLVSVPVLAVIPTQPHDTLAGSGITIYVLQAGPQGINASVTIDGGSPLYNVLPAPTGPNFYVPNVTLFSIQGITTGKHTATMIVQNWDSISSWMMFDYAAINQTIVDATTTSSVASSTAASLRRVPQQRLQPSRRKQFPACPTMTLILVTGQILARSSAGSSAD